jgi:pilus assembly protein CpaB
MILKRKVVGIVVSVLLVAAGTALLVGYVHSAKNSAAEGVNVSQVLVVDEAIPKGTKADEIGSKVRSKGVPANVMAQGALDTLASVAGKLTLVDLLPGDQLVASRFGDSTKINDANVPPGMLQVTVALETTRAIGGQVREGDTVAVLASFDDPDTTHMILQKVLVTHVRSDAGAIVKGTANEASPAGSLKVTLALDAPAVERVVFVAEHGRLWLAWEPRDAPEGGTTVQTVGAVLA